MLSSLSGLLIGRATSLKGNHLRGVDHPCLRRFPAGPARVYDCWDRAASVGGLVHFKLMSLVGTNRTISNVRLEFAFGGKAEAGFR